ncbi:hypothetical protein B0O99DRAFT_689920 [Bisporella sp. PMI_857]|nr:hypothetical protein B0O99DRAFT_689920 [Bisporella sp. PMI_857]
MFPHTSPNLSQHHILCETYEFLCIDVLERQSIKEIFNDMKACKSDYKLKYKYYQEIKGDKSKARDAAFRLLYLILLGEFENETKDSAKVFNAVLFIVSHSKTFKWRTRTVVRAAYEERFVVTEKQRLRLDQWEKTDPTKLAAEDEGDVTTEEDESDGFYTSDYSD